MALKYKHILIGDLMLHLRFGRLPSFGKPCFVIGKGLWPGSEICVYGFVVFVGSSIFV